MNVRPKDLQDFNKLWKKGTGKKLTRAQAIQEFHKLIVLVKLHAEIAIQKEHNSQSVREEKQVNTDKNEDKKASPLTPNPNASKYNKGV